MVAENEVILCGRDSLDEFLIAKWEIEGFLGDFFITTASINYLNFIAS